MQKKRFDVGDISEFDYRQLQADVAAERALLPVLELQRAQQENALAVLLGKSPRAIYEDALEAGSDPEDRTAAIVVPAGLPSDLLLRRPDLVQAAGARERQALAQYQLAIQNAFRDVRDALVAQAKARERLEAESERVTALRTTLRFARLRYQNGMTGQLEVLDAERNLLAAE